MAELLKNRIPVSVSIPYDLLQEIDELANAEKLSRSNFIVKILQQNLKQN